MRNLDTFFNKYGNLTDTPPFFFPFKKTYQVAMSENKVLLRVSLKEDIICGIGPDSFLNICGKFLMLFSSHSS